MLTTTSVEMLFGDLARLRELGDVGIGNLTTTWREGVLARAR
jgi:hypothetical protein